MQVSMSNTFPFRSSIFCTKSDFFTEFNADSERSKILILLSSILIISADASTKLEIVEHLVGLPVYPHFQSCCIRFQNV